MRNRISVLVLPLILGCARAPASGDAPGEDGAGLDEDEDDGDVPSDEDDSDGDDTGGAQLPLVFSVSPRADNVLLADAQIELSEPGSVVIELWSDDVAPQRTAPTALGQSHDVSVVGMRAESAYNLKAIATLEDGSVLISDTIPFQTGALPEGFPPFTVTGSETPEGITLVGATRIGGSKPGSPVLPLFFGVDGEGEVVWYYSPAELAADEENSLRSAELLNDGSLLLILGAGFRVITPGGGLLQELTGADIGAGFDLHHDAEQLPNGNIVVLGRKAETMEVPPFDEPVPVSWDLLFELDAEKNIVWEWSALDHLDIERWPNTMAHVLDERTGYADWTHANSVYYDEPTDQLIVSLRHQNWVIAIDHATGEVSWRLGADGDFNLVGPGEWFDSQHSATLSGDSVLLYDNGNEKIPRESRAVRYELVPEDGAARQEWMWRPEAYTSNLGDADLLQNGNVLVCVGGDQEAGEMTRIVEVDPSGASVWEMEIGDDLWAYRATRVRWLTPAE